MILIVEYIQQNRAKLKEKNEINWMNECCQRIFLYTPCAVEYKYVMFWDQIAMSLLDLMLLFTI